jgi:UDP-N-acetylglucosamine 2-epimerase
MPLLTPHSGTRRVADPTAARPERTRVAVVIGTRPEAIKMAPVVEELRRRAPLFETVVVTTAQHREMLAQALDAFGLRTQVDLGLMLDRQTPAEFTARALGALARCFAELAPDLVLVQGDTSTVLAAVLAATLQGIEVGHVEAGLRSGDLANPFPEELNRRVATCAATLHFAPTELSRRNLLREGVPAERIILTGNTIVDALRSIPRAAGFDEPRLATIPWGERRILLATVHRRENLGEPLLGICQALGDLVRRVADAHVVFPVHLNPRVRETVYAELAERERVTLLDPLGYRDLLETLRRATLVLTDSGGIQEECPALGKPVLILRECTERPEVIDAGFGRLVGTARETVVAATAHLLDHPGELAAMSAGENPFGDGCAARRIVDAIVRRLPAERSGAHAIPRRAELASG